MLRITTCNESGMTRFIVEGKLAGACVFELEKCWRGATGAKSEEPILVDLSRVSFIDASGKQLLARMRETGIRFAATGLMLKFLIEEIESARSMRKDQAAPFD
jgi:hypothetical protein